MIKYHPKKAEILYAMAHKGLSQAALSKEAGVNPSTISNFLHGRYGLSPNSAKCIADVLERELEELFHIEINELVINKYEGR